MPARSDSPDKSEITQILKAWNQGEQEALEKLTPLVYQELRRIARQRMRREDPGHMLQSAALVNEVYLRLVDVTHVSWEDRAHFYAVSAQMMRRILTDIARSRGYAKRGGAARHISIEDAMVASKGPDVDILALDEALDRLGELDRRKAQVVELRYFGGLNVEETAEALGISAETVMRDWKFARGWLSRSLAGEA